MQEAWKVRITSVDSIIFILSFIFTIITTFFLIVNKTNIKYPFSIFFKTINIFHSILCSKGFCMWRHVPYNHQHKWLHGFLPTQHTTDISAHSVNARHLDTSIFLLLQMTTLRQFSYTYGFPSVLDQFLRLHSNSWDSCTRGV